jgi:hypothetical protein
MASAAGVAGHATAVVAANGWRGMRMLIVALQRPVRDRVAVHAARIHDHLRSLAEQGPRACGIVSDACKGRGRAQLALLRLRSCYREDDCAAKHRMEKRCTKAY